MRAGQGDQDGSEPEREGFADRTILGGATASVDIGEIRRAAARLGDLGIAEFAGLAEALAAIERDLAASDPLHPDGHRLRRDVETRLDDLGAALRRLLDVVDRLRSRPV